MWSSGYTHINQGYGFWESKRVKVGSSPTTDEVRISAMWVIKLFICRIGGMVDIAELDSAALKV